MLAAPTLGRRRRPPVAWRSRSETSSLGFADGALSLAARQAGRASADMAGADWARGAGSRDGATWDARLDERLSSASAALEVVTRVRESAMRTGTRPSMPCSARARLDPRDAALPRVWPTARSRRAARWTRRSIASRRRHAPRAARPRRAAVGAYELLFAARRAMRPSARASSSSSQSGPQAAGLANAVLRRLAEAAATFPWGDPAQDDEALARLHAHPRGSRLSGSTSSGAEPPRQVMAADNEPAPLFLAPISSARRSRRRSATRWSRRRRAPSPGPLPAPSWSDRRPARARRRRWQRGDRHRRWTRRPSSPSRRASARPDRHDRRDRRGPRHARRCSCRPLARSAAGGREIVRRRSSRVQDDGSCAPPRERIGVPDVIAVCRRRDATRRRSRLPTPARVDAVLIDAPCSGSARCAAIPRSAGALDPRRSTRSPSSARGCLQRAARLVRPGGFVVYSTCTLAREENDDVVAGFLASEQGEGFALDDAARRGSRRSGGRFVADEGWFQSLPEPDGPDGHFVARLMRVVGRRVAAFEARLKGGSMC